MKPTFATILAFAAAPLVPALAISLMFYGEFEFASLVTFPLVYFLVLIATALLGVPAFALGQRLGLVRWWSTIVVGFFIGALVVVATAYPVSPASAFWLYAGTGAVAGFVFWLVWRLGHRH